MHLDRLNGLVSAVADYVRDDHGICDGRRAVAIHRPLLVQRQCNDDGACCRRLGLHYGDDRWGDVVDLCLLYRQCDAVRPLREGVVVLREAMDIVVQALDEARNGQHTVHATGQRGASVEEVVALDGDRMGGAGVADQRPAPHIARLAHRDLDLEAGLRGRRRGDRQSDRRRRHVQRLVHADAGFHLQSVAQADAIRLQACTQSREVRGEYCGAGCLDFPIVFGEAHDPVVRLSGQAIAAALVFHPDLVDLDLVVSVGVVRVHPESGAARYRALDESLEVAVAGRIDFLEVADLTMRRGSRRIRQGRGAPNRTRLAELQQYLNCVLGNGFDTDRQDRRRREVHDPDAQRRASLREGWVHDVRVGVGRHHVVRARRPVGIHGGVRGEAVDVVLALLIQRRYRVVPDRQRKVHVLQIVHHDGDSGARGIHS
mmetsp:Transcript_22191/g.76145  ORF Transcript_22191/g.76145 Transcript_22191/m.76145 type:complete len:429 (+) Transcript_22191:2304-3590(+)